MRYRIINLYTYAPHIIILHCFLQLTNTYEVKRPDLPNIIMSSVVLEEYYCFYQF